jgi:hypothetical protein
LNGGVKARINAREAIATRQCFELTALVAGTQAGIWLPLRAEALNAGSFECVFKGRRGADDSCAVALTTVARWR